jgi:hypothetical protein
MVGGALRLGCGGVAGITFAGDGAGGSRAGGVATVGGVIGGILIGSAAAGAGGWVGVVVTEAGRGVPLVGRVGVPIGVVAGESGFGRPASAAPNPGFVASGFCRAAVGVAGGFSAAGVAAGVGLVDLGGEDGTDVAGRSGVGVTLSAVWQPTTRPNRTAVPTRADRTPCAIAAPPSRESGAAARPWPA